MLVGYGGTGALMLSRWEYKLIQAFCKTVQLVLNICVTYDAQSLF